MTDTRTAPCFLRATPPNTLHACVTCAPAKVGSGWLWDLVHCVMGTDVAPANLH